MKIIELNSLDFPATFDETRYRMKNYPNFGQHESRSDVSAFLLDPDFKGSDDDSDAAKQVSEMIAVSEKQKTG